MSSATGSISSLLNPDPYASLLAGTKRSDDYTRPLEKGEFAKLLAKLSVDQRAILGQAAELFQQLQQELPKARLRDKQTRESISTHTSLEIQKAARAVIGAMRRDEMKVEVVNSIRLQLYHACLLADDYEKAIALYPALKALVGERMRGIYILHENSRWFVSNAMLKHYFESTPNAEAGLLRIFQDKTMVTETPDMRFQSTIYHFGSLLPMYYLLANCSEISKGLCGNCSGTTEDRLRRILGPQFEVIKSGLIGRLCSFASSFA